MSFGNNLQFLRKMRNKMTQEDLAEKLGVSRQTVSKWELDLVYPEMEKVLELCRLFNCSMDQLIREDMNLADEAYSDIRMECTDPFAFIRYTVISREPEHDAKEHVRMWVKKLGLSAPHMIGWDFPVVSQEQANVYNMHGYTAALILPNETETTEIGCEVVRQRAAKYLAITIREPFRAPFRLIPNAYKAVLAYMQANGIKPCRDQSVIECFEREYVLNNTEYMDVYLAVE